MNKISFIKTQEIKTPYRMTRVNEGNWPHLIASVYNNIITSFHLAGLFVYSAALNVDDITQLYVVQLISYFLFEFASNPSSLICCSKCERALDLVTQFASDVTSYSYKRKANNIPIFSSTHVVSVYIRCWQPLRIKITKERHKYKWGRWRQTKIEFCKINLA